MPSSWFRCRTVVEELIAQTSVDALTDQYERFEDAWNGLVWLLARNPEKIGISRTHESTEYWLCHRRGDAASGIPTIAVIYTFNDTTVTVHAVMAWDAEIEN